MSKTLVMRCVVFPNEAEYSVRTEDRVGLWLFRTDWIIKNWVFNTIMELP